MIRFTDEEIRGFRSDPAFGEITDLLKSRTGKFLSHRLLVPKTGVSNWSHYYYCPDCSVKLELDLDSPESHVCPSCGRSFSDGRMDGAWWMLVNVFNSDAAEDLGLLHMLTGEKRYADCVADMLMEYARYYPGYEIHGDIPYNGPGKLTAQTLDEAVFLRTMGYAYDLVSSAMDEDRKAFVERNLFREGADFLMDHRHPQLHNHEVIIDGAIGVLALILGDDEMLRTAIYGKYGLVYQLENGTLDDGFWFECSTAYHFYALQNFLYYEKFARHTGFSNLSNPRYHDMLLSILRLEKDDLSFPLLNDSHVDQGGAEAYGLFDFAYSIWHDEQVRAILCSLSGKRSGITKESFFYGERNIDMSQAELRLSSVEGRTGLGASVARRGGDYLLFRHGPYGGEHDHYDRLSISYCRNNVPVSIDIGTTGYGAPLHYAYYKRTETHNTFCIDSENQAPSAGRLLEFREENDRILMKAEVEWTADYRMPDSFTILQWSQEAYQGVKAVRTILLVDEGFLDIVEISGAAATATVDLNQHFHGEAVALPDCSKRADLGGKGAYARFENSRAVGDRGICHAVYRNGGIVTDYFFLTGDTECILSEGADNPSNRKMHYVTRRHVGAPVCYKSFVSSGQVVRVRDVEFLDGGIRLIMENGLEKTYMI